MTDRHSPFASTVKLADVLEWLGIDALPAAPVHPGQELGKAGHPLGTDAAGRQHTLTVQTGETLAFAFNPHAIVIADTYGNKDFPKTSFSFIGQLFYNPDGMVLSLDEIRRKVSDTGRFDRIVNPHAETVKTLFSAFKKAKETGHAVGTDGNPAPNLHKIEDAALKP